MVENVTETSVERPRGGRRGLVDYLLDGVTVKISLNEMYVLKIVTYEELRHTCP